MIAQSPAAGLCAGAGALPAPPAALPPAANAPYLRRSSERQLLPGQVADIYRARGARVSDATRQALTNKEVSCVETYERLIGAPFCEQDMPFLQQALTLTSHLCVLRGIKDCARYPKENPGYLTVQFGFKNVFSYISKSKVLNAKTRAAKTRATQSGMDADLQGKIRARRQGVQSPSVSPEAQTVSPESLIVPSGAGIVSETTPSVSSETVKSETGS